MVLVFMTGISYVSNYTESTNLFHIGHQSVFREENLSVTALVVLSVSSDLRKKFWSIITSSLGQPDFHSKQAEYISYEKA